MHAYSMEAESRLTCLHHEIMEQNAHAYIRKAWNRMPKLKLGYKHKSVVQCFD